MTNTVTDFAVDEMWGKACAAYHLQFRPEDRVIEQIVGIQDEVAGRLNHLHRVPPHALHMTILTLVLPTTDKASVARAWTGFGPRCVEVASRLCASSGPIPVAWNTVRAYDKAIVLMGDPHPRLQKFRAEVVDAASSSEFRLSPPWLAHMSLFRYADIDPRLAAFDRPCKPIAVDMHEIRLVREDRYPSLELEIVHRWQPQPAT